MPYLSRAICPNTAEIFLSQPDVSQAARSAAQHSLVGFFSRHWSGNRVAAPTAGRVKRWALMAVRVLVWGHVWFILTTSLVLFLFKGVDPAATTLMMYRKIDYGWKITAPRYVALKRIPRSTRNMAIKVEDGDFFLHHGIVPSAIKYAYTMNKGIGRPTYGGSTITMQTARTIFLVPEKSYLRKYFEVIIALEMEAILGKERILELYFNYAEWGRGIFGIDAAARYHYKRGIASLDTDQAVRLITLLSSPIKYKPYTIQKNGILRSRYEYLVSRYEAPVDESDKVKPVTGTANEVPMAVDHQPATDEFTKPAVQ